MKEQDIPSSAIEKSKFLSRIFVFLFSAMLVVPMLFFFFDKRPVKLENELRSIARRPNLVWDSILSFPKRYNTYYNDNFPFRLPLVRMNSYLKVKLFDTSPLPHRVIVGKDNWLFYTPCVSDTFQMEDFAGEIPYSKHTLQTIRKNIMEEKKYLEEKHVRFIVVVVPNKQDIYSEYLPDVYNDDKGVSRLDQLAGSVKDLDYFIDLREALKKGKAKYGDKELYYRTDTHWNQLGAVIGWQQIWKKIIPDAAQKEFSVHFSKDTLAGLDLAHMIAIPEAYKDDYVYTIKFTVDQKFHKALVYHDSFYGMMEPYFNNCFDSTIQTEHWGGVHRSQIEKEKPDLVLLEISERYLNVLEKPLN